MKVIVDLTSNVISKANETMKITQLDFDEVVEAALHSYCDDINNAIPK